MNGQTSGEHDLLGRHDVLDLASLLSEAELAQRDKIREFTERRIKPQIARWFEDAYFPLELSPNWAPSACSVCTWTATAAPGRPPSSTV